VQLARQLLHDAPAVPHCDASAVDARLVAALADATNRWPGVVIAPGAFVSWVAARIPAHAPTIEAALDGLRLADLYLACACAAGDSSALAAFDAAFLRGDSSDDVKQRLRQKLFVARPDGTAPRIALYAGRGGLGHWVRAALTRMTIDEARVNREVPTEDALLDALGIDPEHGPELAAVKRDARQTLQAAVREAVATLADRDRTLLLQYYVDGVGLAQLGKLVGLSPSSVSRTIAKARLSLVSRIKRALMKHKKISGDELDSLVELVRSQLSLTGELRRR
jgi:RNA polymerase sigma-70 factor (ECF subfamily)